MNHTTLTPALVESTLSRYRPADRFTQGFVRGKLRCDPVYQYLLTRPDLFPRSGRLLDLGCGHGIALALLSTAWRFGASRPPGLTLQGIERQYSRAATAQRALGEDAAIAIDDLRRCELPPCHAALLLDVLLYLTVDDQDRLLERVAQALVGQGVLIMREADADAGFPFQLTRLTERLCAWGRGHFRQRYHYRPAAEWTARLQGLGFRVEAVPMSQGTPFANVLFIGRRGAGVGARPEGASWQGVYNLPSTIR